MLQISKNGTRALLLILKDFTESYNSSTLAKKLGITSMGALKIMRSLEANGLVEGKTLGRATFYRFCHENEYAREFAKLLLRSDAESSPPRVKRWVRELKKLEGTAELAVLFGSVLSSDNYNDVDVLAVCRKNSADKAKQAAARIQSLSGKKIQIIWQTEADLSKNLKEKNPAVMAAMRQGVIAFGYGKYVGALSHAI